MPEQGKGRKAKKEIKEANTGKLEKRQARRANAHRRVGLGEDGDAAYCAENVLPAKEEETEEEDEKEEAAEEDEDEKVEEESDAPAKEEVPQIEATVEAEDDEEIKDIKRGLRAQLLAWASDGSLPLAEQKRLVRQLLAQWHPDKNRHIAQVATNIFQFIQEEVQRILAQLRAEVGSEERKAAEAKQRQAQRAAEKSAKASALEASRREKQQRRGEVEEPAPDVAPDAQEWSLVVGHGPATCAYLRPWPRSHFSLTRNVDGRDDILLFGGEAYDGRELTFYSDLYRLDMGSIESGVPLPWEKLYSAVPSLPGPEARSAHQAFYWQGHLYIFGGEWSSRDQKRYRQFQDLWRLSPAPGKRWERLEAGGSMPSPRSGHRMAVVGDYGVLYGGFSEDKKRRASYLDDFYALHLPSHTWRLLPSERCSPKARAGCLLFAAASSVFLYGGSRPTRKGGDTLQVLEDLWCAKLGRAGAVWEQLATQGEGPGRRSGMCHCPLSEKEPLRRLVFGGVADHRVASTGADGTKRAAELAVFHQDIFLLDCTGTPRWERLWPRLAPALELPAVGGGCDAYQLALRGPTGEAAREAPRGRMAAACLVAQGSFWIFGGACESGPKQEVTLDDLWRLPLQMERKDDSVEVSCSDRWECVLPLSDRATVWFDDSETDSEEEDPEQGISKAPGGTLVEVKNPGGGVLSKKQQKEEQKRQRMDLKRERQAEKCEEKTAKRDQKKEKQRQHAKQS